MYVRSTACDHVIVNGKCVPSKFHPSSSKILAQLSVFAWQDKGSLKVNIIALTRTCVLVPWAQLQSLMVCTGESLQWLPPHGPLNTSGHMVCLVGRERVSRTEPDSSIHSQTARPPHCCLKDLLALFLVIDLHYCVITTLYFAVIHELVHTFVQPKPLAMGYLYAAVEVRPMVCGLPPWYDPLKEQKK